MQRSFRYVAKCLSEAKMAEIYLQVAKCTNAVTRKQFKYDFPHLILIFKHNGNVLALNAAANFHSKMATSYRSSLTGSLAQTDHFCRKKVSTPSGLV